MKKYEVEFYVGTITYIIDADNEDQAIAKAEPMVDAYLKRRGSDAAGETCISELDKCDNCGELFDLDYLNSSRYDVNKKRLRCCPDCSTKMEKNGIYMVPND
jgi:hypothetical protein